MKRNEKRMTPVSPTPTPTIKIQWVEVACLTKDMFESTECGRFFATGDGAGEGNWKNGFAFRVKTAIQENVPLETVYVRENSLKKFLKIFTR